MTRWEDIGHVTEPYPTAFRGDSVYGVRGHVYYPQQSYTVTFGPSEINRPAAELLFDLCIKCQSTTLATCACHERGYN